MKTRNSWIFVLAAFFCGALFCTQASAKVCFVGDKECGSGANFAPAEELPNEDLCRQEKYDTLASACANPGGVCPYDARYVRCCPSEYAYQACVYPLETVKKIVDGKTTVDRCGRLYKCQCPSEYGVTSDYAKTNNCQPGGGYCMLNDGTTDQVKYKTCSCDTSVYTDATKCSNNQSEEASCTNEKGEVRKKCYCNRSRFPYAACEYGSKGTVCIDSNINREYYQQCKSAEEKCREEGFEWNECSQVHNCVSENGKYTSYNCVLGPACPYPVNPFLYKCVFDKATWCTSNGYTSSMTVKPTNGAKCTTPDGFVGTYDVCPANDSNSLFYYNCKLPCEQEVRRAYSKGYLTLDSAMTADDGTVVGYVRSDGSNRHLYIIKDFTLPTSNKGRWRDIGNKVDYATINGMFALGDTNMKYPDGSYMFSSCKDERTTTAYYNRPTMRINTDQVGNDNYFLDKSMSDISVAIYNNGSFKTYIVNNPTWNNFNLDAYGMPNSSKVRDEYNYKFLRTQTQIVIKGGKWLTITGESGFWSAAGTYGSPCQKDTYTGACFYYRGTHFRAEGGARVKFDGATIVSSGIGWDGDDAGMLFYNTKMKNSSSSLGDIWSGWNIGMSNSTIKAKMIRIRSYNSTTDVFDGGCSGGDSGAMVSYCHGIYLTRYSKLSTETYGSLWGNNTKIYVAFGSTLDAAPFHLAARNENIVCLNYTTAKFNGISYGSTSARKVIYGWYDDNRYTGVNARYTDAGTGTNGEWYWHFLKRTDTYPCGTSGKCDGKCNSEYGANKRDNSHLCTGCASCSNCGMGY